MLILQNQALQLRELTPREAEVSHQCHGNEPELRRRIIAVDMDMRGFIRLMAEEVYPVRAGAKDRGHPAATLPCAARSVAGCRLSG